MVISLFLGTSRFKLLNNSLLYPPDFLLLFNGQCPWLLEANFETVLAYFLNLFHVRTCTENDSICMAYAHKLKRLLRARSDLLGCP